MQYITKDGSSPKGLPKIYITGHPDDCRRYSGHIREDLFRQHNCAVFYDENPEHPEDMENFSNDLRTMKLVVLIVTSKFVYGDTFAFREVFRQAIADHIPVLPILEEHGIQEDFNEKCGNLQFLDPNSHDETEISYEDKLNKFLDSVLIGDELAEKVRKAFDAYVFLSYRKKDRKYAQELMRLIHQNAFCRDIAIWYDEFLVPGEDFNAAIASALSGSKLFALAVTPSLLEQGNYVMSNEYPAARKANKPILPVSLLPTDNDKLQAHYEGIPDLIDCSNADAVTDALRQALRDVLKVENDSDPEHVFFIGLAYLNGIDVEVDHKRAVEMITFAAEHDLPEAVRKLVAMYRNGEGVERDTEAAILWQKKWVALCQAMYEKHDDEPDGGPGVLPDYEAAAVAWMDALWELGGIQSEASHYARALETYQKMLEVNDMFRQKRNAEFNVSAIYERMGDVARQMGELGDAEDYYRKCSITSALKLAEVAGAKGYLWEERDLYSRIQKQFENGNSTRNKRMLAEIHLRAAIMHMRYEATDYDLRKHIEKSLELIEDIAAQSNEPQDRETLYKIYMLNGRFRSNLLEFGEADTAYEKAQTILKSLSEQTDSLRVKADYAQLCFQSGIVRLGQGNRAQARAYFEEGHQLFEQIAGQAALVWAQSMLVHSHLMLGTFYGIEGDSDSKDAHYKEAFRLQSSLTEQSDSLEVMEGLADSYLLFGDVCMKEQDIPGATQHYQKALALAMHVDGGESEDMIKYRKYKLYKRAEKFKDDKHYIKRSIKSKYLLIECYMRFGSIYQLQGQYEESMDYFLKAELLGYFLQSYVDSKTTHGYILKNYTLLGNLNEAKGDLTQAGKEYMSAVKYSYYANRYYIVTFCMVDVYHRLAVLNRALGEEEEAESYENKSKELQQFYTEAIGSGETAFMTSYFQLMQFCNRVAELSEVVTEAVQEGTISERSEQVKTLMIKTAEEYRENQIQFYKSIADDLKQEVDEADEKKDDITSWKAQVKLIPVYERLSELCPEMTVYHKLIETTQKMLKHTYKIISALFQITDAALLDTYNRDPFYKGYLTICRLHPEPFQDFEEFLDLLTNLSFPEFVQEERRQEQIQFYTSNAAIWWQVRKEANEKKDDITCWKASAKLMSIYERLSELCPERTDYVETFKTLQDYLEDTYKLISYIMNAITNKDGWMDLLDNQPDFKDYLTIYILHPESFQDFEEFLDFLRNLPDKSDN